MEKELLTIEHLKKSFGDNVILDDVNLTVKQGEVIVIIGPSGCGKSTLLRCINALEPIQEGQILLDGEKIEPKSKNLTQLRQKIGMVFQSYELFPHLSVRSNMLFGRRFRGPSGVSFEDVVALLGLGRLLHRTPSDLSGGEKQRVAVGRALLACPELLLMDEPLTGLDRGKREEIMAYVKAIPERFGVPILYVTHSDAERRFLADRVLNIEDGKLTDY